MGISSDEDSDPEYDINEDEDFWDDMDEDEDEDLIDLESWVRWVISLSSSVSEISKSVR